MRSSYYKKKIIEWSQEVCLGEARAQHQSPVWSADTRPHTVNSSYCRSHSSINRRKFDRKTGFSHGSDLFLLILWFIPADPMEVINETPMPGCICVYNDGANYGRKL